jgi:hypothetical protein
MPVKYRKESDGKYHAQANSKDTRYGLQFSSYSAMRKAFKSTIKLKQVKRSKK